MDHVTLAGRKVGRIGMSLAGLRTAGMWGEPARPAALAVLRRAVEMGAAVIEVPVPFGPFADLVREVGAGDSLVVARLTGPVAGPEVLLARLGAVPALVLAEPALLAAVCVWGLPCGAVIGPDGSLPEAGAEGPVRGPYPPPDGVVEACERAGVPYLAPAVEVLALGAMTVAVPALRSVAAVEALFGEGATPPAGGPG